MAVETRDSEIVQCGHMDPREVVWASILMKEWKGPKCRVDGWMGPTTEGTVRISFLVYRINLHVRHWLDLEQLKKFSLLHPFEEWNVGLPGVGRG